MKSKIHLPKARQPRDFKKEQNEMTKFQYELRGDEACVWKQISAMTEEDAKSELAEVMKIWKAICDRLLPHVLSTCQKITPQLSSNSRRAHKLVWSSVLRICGSGIDDGKSDSLIFKSMFRRHSYAAYLAYDEFESKTKSQLCEAIKSLGHLFSGEDVPFDVCMPDNGKQDVVMMFGCHASGTLSSCRHVTAAFPKCSSLEDIIVTMAICGLGLGVV